MLGAVVLEDSIHAGDSLNVIGEFKSGLGGCRIRHLGREKRCQNADSAFMEIAFIERSKVNKMDGEFERL